MDVKNRSKLESQLARALGKQFAAQRKELLNLLGDPPNVGNVPDVFWEQAGAEFKQFMEPFLAEVFTAQAETFGEEMDTTWTLANEAAAQWAKQYTFDLVNGVNANSQAQLQDAVDRFFRDGLTLGELTDAIGQIFGPGRAELIAITEITRAVDESDHEQTDMLKGMGFVFQEIWDTNNDDLVCEICGPLDGTVTEERVPAHPGCRCRKRFELVSA